MAISINDLAIEVTRRCNMECPHCLRGDAENIDMDIKYVDELFSKIDIVHTLTLTGGEPSLVPDIINQILDSIIRNNVEVSYFYLVTNAKKITMEFIYSLLRMYQETSEYYEDEMTLVQYSNDGYHDDIDREGLRLLQALKFVSPKSSEDGKIYNRSLISQGRAEWNYACERHIEPDKFRIQEEQDSEHFYIEEGLLYLNCEGHLISGCDWSYDSQDDEEHECRICPVNEFSLEKLRKFEYENTCV